MATRIKKTDLARDALYDKVNTMIDEVNTKIDNKDSLPSQTGNAGKFLTTDGTNASWGEVKQIEIKQDLTNPSADTVPSTKAVKDESSRITTLMNTKVSNCITEIPQDIKLELNNGTLTLKAGSKVYVPNGAGVFDEVVISNDVTAGIPYMNEPIFVYYFNNSIQQASYSHQCSGASNTISAGYWYDTTNNFIKRIDNSEVSYYGAISFPIAIVSTSNGDWTSIDQVFNGFGYTGSTIFALPGVKGLIPNGRNADGSLRNVEFILDKVSTYNCTLSSYFGIKLEGTRPILGIYGEQLYNSSSNTVIFNGVEYKWMYSGSLIYSNGRITSLTPKTTFHALDYNDKSTISGWSMPSDKYIDLTLGASDTRYTAPANGFFFAEKVTQEAGQFFIFNTANMEQGSIAVVAGNWVGGFVPVKKGMNCTILYTASGATRYFRFIYAEGE